MDSNPGRKNNWIHCWPIHCVDILLQPRPLQAGAAHRPPLPLLLPPPAVEKQLHHHDYSWSWSSLLQITTIAFTNKTRNIIIVYYCRFTVQGHRWSSGNPGAKETFQFHSVASFEHLFSSDARCVWKAVHLDPLVKVALHVSHVRGVRRVGCLSSQNSCSAKLATTWNPTHAEAKRTSFTQLPAFEHLFSSDARCVWKAVHLDPLVKVALHVSHVLQPPFRRSETGPRIAPRSLSGGCEVDLAHFFCHTLSRFASIPNVGLKGIWRPSSPPFDHLAISVAGPDGWSSSETEGSVCRGLPRASPKAFAEASSKEVTAALGRTLPSSVRNSGAWSSDPPR